MKTLMEIYVELTKDENRILTSKDNKEQLEQLKDYIVKQEERELKDLSVSDCQMVREKLETVVWLDCSKEVEILLERLGNLVDKRLKLNKDERISDPNIGPNIFSSKEEEKEYKKIIEADVKNNLNEIFKIAEKYVKDIKDLESKNLSDEELEKKKQEIKEAADKDAEPFMGVIKKAINDVKDKKYYEGLELISNKLAGYGILAAGSDKEKEEILTAMSIYVKSIDDEVERAKKVVPEPKKKKNEQEIDPKYLEPYEPCDYEFLTLEALDEKVNILVYKYKNERTDDKREFYSEEFKKIKEALNKKKDKYKKMKKANLEGQMDACDNMLMFANSNKDLDEKSKSDLIKIAESMKNGIEEKEKDRKAYKKYKAGINKAIKVDSLETYIKKNPKATLKLTYTKKIVAGVIATTILAVCGIALKSYNNKLNNNTSVSNSIDKDQDKTKENVSNKKEEPTTEEQVVAAIDELNEENEYVESDSISTDKETSKKEQDKENKIKKAVEDAENGYSDIGNSTNLTGNTNNASGYNVTPSYESNGTTPQGGSSDSISNPDGASNTGGSSDSISDKKEDTTETILPEADAQEEESAAQDCLLTEKIGMDLFINGPEIALEDEKENKVKPKVNDDMEIIYTGDEEDHIQPTDDTPVEKEDYTIPEQEIIHNEGEIDTGDTPVDENNHSIPVDDTGSSSSENNENTTQNDMVVEETGSEQSETPSSEENQNSEESSENTENNENQSTNDMVVEETGSEQESKSESEETDFTIIQYDESSYTLEETGATEDEPIDYIGNNLDDYITYSNEEKITTDEQDENATMDTSNYIVDENVYTYTYTPSN